MKKATVLLLGLLLVLSVLTACGKPAVEAGSTTAATLATSATETTQPPAASGSEITETEPNDTETTTESASEDTTTDPEGTTAKTEGGIKEPETIKEAIALYAAAVDKTLKANPVITKRCLKVIQRPLEGDDPVLRLFGIQIAGYGVEKTICEDLFGEGDVTYVQPAKGGLQPCWLRESDVTGFIAKTLPNGDIELHIGIKDSTNPTKPKDNEGPSPIGNVTWDFTSLKDIREGIVDAQSTVPGLRINIATIRTDFYNCQGKMVIRPDGSFASLTHIADNKVRVEDVEVRLIGIRLGGGEWGGGVGKGTITYVF